MRQVLVGILLASFLVGACTEASSPPADGPSTTSEATPEGGLSPAEGEGASIYAAAIRAMKRQTGNVRRIYVLDMTHTDAGKPGSFKMGERVPITQEVQNAIKKMVTAVPISFVHRRDEVTIEEHGCLQVKPRGGVLITLGPIQGAGDKRAVGVGGFVACLGGLWTTYVIEKRDGSWAMTGTRGPVAIS